ncbi:hypothetical protein [Burkholderia cepacia]|uniref:hypothetical protein n=1 Tax=Burkholderia cepacia TaxID=292 RepID=UPI003D664675
MADINRGVLGSYIYRSDEQLFWRGYLFLVPPVVAVLIAVGFIVRGDKDFSGGIFVGLVSMPCVIIVLVIFLIDGFSGNSYPIVNGWK